MSPQGWLRQREAEGAQIPLPQGWFAAALEVAEQRNGGADLCRRVSHGHPADGSADLKEVVQVRPTPR